MQRLQTAPSPECRVGTAARAPRSGPRAALALARPAQWIKNMLIVAAPAAAGALGRDDVLGRVLAASVSFCLVSAGVYAFNDVRDRDEDREHPRKRHRPVAAREISVRNAAGLGTVWIGAGLACSLVVSPVLLAVTVVYLLVMVTYIAVWRHVAPLDLGVLAAGFVLRAIAGGAAAPVGLSRWFLVVVSCAAIFAAAGKRLGELLRASTSGSAVRRVLRHYTVGRLRALLAASGLGALVAYGVWALRGGDPGALWRALTIIPFTASIVRYGALAVRGRGETPERLVVADRALTVSGLCWFALFTCSVDAAA